VSKYATIPDFVDGDSKSMAVSLRAMKQVLESLTGQRQDDSKGAPAVYVQATLPLDKRNSLQPGDFWINTGTKVLSYYNGIYWVAL